MYGWMKKDNYTLRRKTCRETAMTRTLLLSTLLCCVSLGCGDTEGDVGDHCHADEECQEGLVCIMEDGPHGACAESED